MTRMTPEDKVAAWYRAYTAIREELTPKALRNQAVPTALMPPPSFTITTDTLILAMMANDRTAAIVAAMLVSQGIRPVPVEVEE